METNDVLKGLEFAFDNLQKLGIQPTKTNIMILSGTLTALENAFKFIKEKEAGNGREDNNAE